MDSDILYIIVHFCGIVTSFKSLLVSFKYYKTLKGQFSNYFYSSSTLIYYMYYRDRNLLLPFHTTFIIDRVKLKLRNMMTKQIISEFPPNYSGCNDSLGLFISNFYVWCLSVKFGNLIEGFFQLDCTETQAILLIYELNFCNLPKISDPSFQVI